MTNILSFINKNKWIAGISFPLFLIFSEVIPLTNTIGDIAKQDLMFSISYFVTPFSFLADLNSWFLVVPSALFLSLSLLPLLDRKFNKPLFALFLTGFAFYPLLYLFKGTWFEALIWSVLLAPVVALNLWIRSIDYFYAMALGLGLMDLGAAIWGYRLGLEAIGVPYHSGLSPTIIMVIDCSLIAIVILLWWRRFDFGRALRLKWLVALE